MTTIQLEAEVSAEQLLHAVEQLPPKEFAAFLNQLLARIRNAASVSAADDVSAPPEHGSGNNPYLAAAGMFATDTFAADVEAFINAQREREREEAARAAGT